MDSKKTYFISYTTRTKKDIAWAKWIEWFFREVVGGKTIIQEYDFKLGGNFRVYMHEALQRADFVVGVLSRDYIESANCTLEWINSENFVPLRIDDCAPNGLLKYHIYINLHGLSRDEAKSKLAEELKEKVRSSKEPEWPETPASAAGNSSEPDFPSLAQSNLPERNQYFYGRGEVMDTIHTQFQLGGMICLKQKITGLGGVGKTQTAIEYAHRFKSEYADAIWWIHAETETTAFNDCLNFADAFGLVPEGVDEARKLSPAQLGKRLKDWLETKHSWLFIFDNVEQSEVIAPYVSGLQSGHVLITTRERGLKLGKSVDIKLYTPDEAAKFMRNRLEESQSLIGGESDLAALTERLSYFPLALEQAATHMEHTHIDSARYLALLDSVGLKVLNEKLSNAANYHRAVTGTLMLSFDKLSESARQLFNLIAYMSPDLIPLDFFKRQREHLPQPLREDFGDELRSNGLVAELLNYSLVKRDGNFLNIHRLVQEVGRETLEGDETYWLGICVAAVIAEMPGMKDFSCLEHRERFEHISSHAAGIATYAEKACGSVADKEKQIAFIYHRLGLGDSELSRYDQALDMKKYWAKSIQIAPSLIAT
ncbi:MAG: TIR domain-containing protein [Oscillospiraceae bacterium]|nr:TIR domain-containing protein [Oscillospiraceae bacterium]